MKVFQKQNIFIDTKTCLYAFTQSIFENTAGALSIQWWLNNELQIKLEILWI